MRVLSLTARSFRNLGELRFEPHEGLNVVYGENAQGKTNLLEAMWLFTGGRSFRGAKDSELVRHHFELESNLSLYLDDAQIEAVKDGMTYGVVKKTYDAHCDMIPTLKDFEKKLILAWLKEAREYAMDAENSNKKHAAFGKYKGRINNYLSKQGYDLTKEREAWYERMKAQGKKF